MGMTYFVSEWVVPGQHSVESIARTFSNMVIDGLGRGPANGVARVPRRKALQKRVA
jgi:hypothetical protein